MLYAQLAVLNAVRSSATWGVDHLRRFLLMELKTEGKTHIGSGCAARNSPFETTWETQVALIRKRKPDVGATACAHRRHNSTAAKGRG